MTRGARVPAPGRPRRRLRLPRPGRRDRASRRLGYPDLCERDRHHRRPHRPDSHGRSARVPPIPSRAGPSSSPPTTGSARSASRRRSATSATTPLERTSFLFGSGPGLGRVTKPRVVDILPTVLHQIGLRAPELEHRRALAKPRKAGVVGLRPAARKEALDHPPEARYGLRADARWWCCGCRWPRRRPPRG